MPMIYHGHTLTTRIKLIDVLKTIRDHAFVTSEYPVILSIENHCSLSQQRQMAIALKEILGEHLLCQPLSADEQSMPSPSQLKRKFIIKHKKLTENAGSFDGSASFRDDPSESVDIGHKSGLLYMDEMGDGQLRSFFFVLTNTKLCYTDIGATANGTGDEEMDDQDDRMSQLGSMQEQELHYAEKWYHGRLPGRRAQAERLLRQHCKLGEGTFLVRESDTFVGDYSLSFWHQNRPNHCHIRSVQEKGQTKYFLIKNLLFDSLYALISYYLCNPLRTNDFIVQLKQPVPQPSSHENREWYHDRLARSEAEDLLKRVQLDGAFLVRPSENGGYSVSFRAEGRIKHCRVLHDERLYVIGTSTFESLVDLVEFYERHPLYKRVTLKHPVNEETLHKLTEVSTGIELK